MSNMETPGALAPGQFKIRDSIMKIQINSIKIIAVVDLRLEEVVTLGSLGNSDRTLSLPPSVGRNLDRA